MVADTGDREDAIHDTSANEYSQAVLAQACAVHSDQQVNSGGIEEGQFAEIDLDQGRVASVGRVELSFQDWDGR